MFVRLPHGRLVPCVFASSFLCRLKGLLGTRRDALAGGAMLLSPCASIHTIGMTYSLDVAFLDAGGQVVKAVENLAPGRVVGARGAASVLERACEDGTPWFHVGDVVEFSTSRTQFQKF